MVSPGHITGFGLLPNSAIDQHVNARGGANVISTWSLLRIPNCLVSVWNKMRQSWSMVIHFLLSVGKSRYTMGSHTMARTISSFHGQSYDLKTRSVEP